MLVRFYLFLVECNLQLIAISQRIMYNILNDKKRRDDIMADTAAIGNAIAQLRRAMHLTQQSLAAFLYVSHQAVSKWEHGVSHS